MFVKIVRRASNNGDNSTAIHECVSTIIFGVEKGNDGYEEGKDKVLLRLFKEGSHNVDDYYIDRAELSSQKYNEKTKTVKAKLSELEVYFLNSNGKTIDRLY